MFAFLLVPWTIPSESMQIDCIVALVYTQKMVHPTASPQQCLAGSTAAWVMPNSRPYGFCLPTYWGVTSCVINHHDHTATWSHSRHPPSCTISLGERRVVPHLTNGEGRSRGGVSEATILGMFLWSSRVRLCVEVGSCDWYRLGFRWTGQ